jgi:8-oxo-dGTP diphosphatase
MNKQNSKYQFAAVSTDVILFSLIENELCVLLIKMKKHPFEDCWAAPGGLVGASESVDAAAKRLLLTETGLKDIYLEQLYTFGNVDRDPFGRVVSVAYYALVPGQIGELKTSKDYGGIGWFNVRKMPKLAYDHHEMVQLALKRLQRKIGFTNVAYSLLPEEFTLSELQQVYEIIWGKAVDKRNFRKKMLSLDIIKATGKRESGKQNRPAELFRFSENKLIELRIF